MTIDDENEIIADSYRSSLDLVLYKIDEKLMSEGDIKSHRND